MSRLPSTIVGEHEEIAKDGDGRLVVACAWHQGYWGTDRFRIAGDWASIRPEGRIVSHGMCPECVDRLKSESGILSHGAATAS